MFGLVLLCHCAVQIKTADSEAFPAPLPARAVAATVRVYNPFRSHAATGVLIRRQGSHAYVLTVAHVVGKDRIMEVSTFSGRSYPRVEKTYRLADVLARDAR